MYKTFLEFLYEKNLGTIDIKVDLDIDVEASKHAIERQNRKENINNEPITDVEMISDIQRAIPRIMKDLSRDRINISDIDNTNKFIIYNKDTHNNVVCVIDGTFPYYRIKAITVIRTENIKKGRNQLKIIVSEYDKMPTQLPLPNTRKRRV